MRILKRSSWPFVVALTDEDHQAETWLHDNLGSFRERWNIVPSHSCKYFYFREEGDLVFFSLLWKK